MHHDEFNESSEELYDCREPRIMEEREEPNTNQIFDETNNQLNIMVRAMDEIKEDQIKVNINV